MTEVRESCELGASAHQVWTLISDFGGFAEMLVASRDGTVQVSGTAIGMTRTVTIGDDHLIERLEDFDDINWRTGYSMLATGPLPIADYRATISLSPLAGDRCALDWVGSFVPDGASETEAADAVRTVYVEGIELMRQRFGG
jgi:hypothetical protein